MLRKYTQWKEVLEAYKIDKKIANNVQTMFPTREEFCKFWDEWEQACKRIRPHVR